MVATPGRIQDYLDASRCNSAPYTRLILEKLTGMLDMGFLPRYPQNRQHPSQGNAKPCASPQPRKAIMQRLVKDSPRIPFA